MEDSKKIYTFYGKAGEDYHLWCARTQAALESKALLEMIRHDALMEHENPDEPLLQKVETARAVIIQGLGNRPLRLCLAVKENLYLIWKRLKDRYAVSNTATKVQLKAKLSRMNYKGESMEDYIDSFEEIFNRLAAMDNMFAEDLQVAMLLASFGDKKTSPFGHVLASLRTRQEDLDWETTTSTLLQESEDQMIRSEKPVKRNDSGRALTTGGERQKSWRKQRRKQSTRFEKRRCFRCRKIGHIVKDCPYDDEEAQPSGSSAKSDSANQAQLLMAKHEHSVENGSPVIVKGDEMHHNTAETSGSDKEDNMFIFDSGASDHMVWSNDYLRDIVDIEPRPITVGKGNIVYASQRGILSLRTFVGPDKNRDERVLVIQEVLFVPQLHANLLSCSRLCESGYNIKFSKEYCYAEHFGVLHFRATKERGIYHIKTFPVEQGENHRQAYMVQDDGSRVTKGRRISQHSMQLWHERLGHANTNSIVQLIRSNAVIGVHVKTEK